MQTKRMVAILTTVTVFVWAVLRWLFDQLTGNYVYDLLRNNLSIPAWLASPIVVGAFLNTLFLAIVLSAVLGFWLRRAPSSAVEPDSRTQPQSGEVLLADKRRLIADARAFVAAALKKSRRDGDFREALESDEAFMKLHPHLSDKFLHSLRPGRVVMVRGPSGSTMPDTAIDFLKEIDRLESDWGLR